MEIMHLDDPRPNVALVGCGYWGPNYVRVFEENRNARITLACDLQEEELSNLRSRYPHLEGETDPDRVLASDEIDAVVVATPARSHYDVTRQALEAGKDVLVEKPLALDLANARELARLAEERDCVLMVGHIFEYNPAVHKLKEVVDEPETGELHYLTFQRRSLGPVRQDVNAMWDLAPHDVSILHYLTGEMPERVAAQGMDFLQDGVEDVVFLTLWMPSGQIAHVHASWMDPHKVRRVVAVGEDRMVTFDDVEPREKIRIHDKGAVIEPTDAPADFAEFQIQVRDGDVLSPAVPGREPLRSQVDHFVECVRERKRPRSDAVSGARVVSVLEAVDRALESQAVEKVEPVGSTP